MTALVDGQRACGCEPVKNRVCDWHKIEALQLQIARLQNVIEVQDHIIRNYEAQMSTLRVLART